MVTLIHKLELQDLCEGVSIVKELVLIILHQYSQRYMLQEFQILCSLMLPSICEGEGEENSFLKIIGSY